MAEPLRAPSPFLLVNEVFALRELPRLLLRFPELAREPRGGGEPVRVFPGFGAGDASTLPVRAYLGYLGYEVDGWGLGTNRGDVPALIPRLVERTRAISEEAGRPVRLVGWSLGGVLAREVAREAPEAVDRVVTFGSPVVGGPKYTTAGRYYQRQGFDLDQIERDVAAREAVPLRRPVTAIYSRRDGVVAWQACIDRANADVEHVEVEASHLGLGISPDVFRILARRLAPTPA